MKKLILSVFTYFTVMDLIAQITVIRPDTIDHYSIHPVNGKVLYGHSSVHPNSFIYELWATDGTAAGTALVKDINPNSHDDLFSFFTTTGVQRYFSSVYNNELYFLADDGVHGMEFWKSDGTTAGTNLFFETEPGMMGWDFVDSKVPGFCESNGTLFFKSGNSVNGYELWKTDGTVSGTAEVKDIYPGSTGSNPHFITSFNGKAYFTAKDPVYGWELFCSDGTVAGTYMVKDIVTGINGAFNDGMNISFNPQFRVSGNYLYFQADNNGFTPVEGHWWRTDGTANGTIQLETTLTAYEALGISYGRSITTADLNGEFLFLVPTVQSHTQIWKSDGTVAGTTQVLTTNGLEMFPSLIGIGSNVYFSGRDNDSSGLAITNGTTVGTDIIFPYEEAPYFARIAFPTCINGNMFFLMSKWFDALWATQDRVVQSNGTTQGTIVYPGVVPISKLIPLGNGDIIFYGTDSLNQAPDNTKLFRLHPDSIGPAAGVGIEENSGDSSYIYAYPNPASDKVNISTKNFDMSGSVISMIDLAGRIVFIQHLDNASARFSINIPGSIVNGIYFLSLMNAKSDKTAVRIVVQRD